MLKLIKFWFPLVVYSGIIFCVSSLPRLTPSFGGLNVDKIFHIGEYIPFGFLAARALGSLKLPASAKTILWQAVLLACLYAISDEYHQSFVEGRFSSAWDVVADTTGGFIGALIFIKLNRKNRENPAE